MYQNMYPERYKEDNTLMCQKKYYCTLYEGQGFLS